MSHVTHMNESCHTHEQVRSHTWMSHITHINESCHQHEWVMSHTPMSHVTHMNESRHTHVKEIPEYWYIRPSPPNNQELGYKSCQTYEGVTSHPEMSHVTHMDESCHTHICSNVLHVDIYARRPLTFIHSWMSDATHMEESCHTHEWVTPLTFELASGVLACESSLLSKNHECVNGWCHTHERVISHTWMSHATHIHGGINIYVLCRH